MASRLLASGHGILKAAPCLMRGLSVAGTAAMFLVGILAGAVTLAGVTSGKRLVQRFS